MGAPVWDGNERVVVTFAFRTVPYRLKIKLLGEPGQAEEMAAHRLRENEWILSVGKDSAGKVS